MALKDPTARFTGRSGAYEKTRPSYPAETLDVLRTHAGLGHESVVADLGSGTGIFTRLLLSSGATVWAVEPNDEMRRAAEAELGEEQRFHSVEGRAEATTLPDASVDLVTAAQAFHWFDADAASAEMRRILRGPPRGGFVALVWNDRDLAGTPFLREYEALLVAHCPEYRALQGKSDTPAKFDALFGRGRWTRHVAKNAQRLDREGLVLRVRSASYAPADDAALARALEALFDRHAKDGAIEIPYTTAIIVGRVSSSR